MNISGVGAVAATRSRPRQSSIDTAWLVLEAANDLGDYTTVEACRRVLDANLNGSAAVRSDLNRLLDYFR